MAETLLPPVDQHVVLGFDGTEHDSVVDDVDGDGRVFVREPLQVGGGRVSLRPEGTSIRLEWATKRGRHSVVTTVDGVSGDRVRLWHLTPEGSTQTTQLRRFARAGDALPATVSRDGRTWSALVADLGEGGARCIVSDLGEGGARCVVVADTEELHVADDVVLSVTVDGEDLRLPAHVLEVLALQSGRSQLRLAFGDIGRAADVLRRRVLAQQRRERALTS